MPVVTTAIGNEGLDLQHGEQAMLGETAAELASCILRLFADPGLVERLASAGQAVVDGRYTRAAAAESLRLALGPRRARGVRP